jgi:hypothetical protein
MSCGSDRCSAWDSCIQCLLPGSSLACREGYSIFFASQQRMFAPERRLSIKALEHTAPTTLLLAKAVATLGD